jgi:hypothetical protein
MARWIVILTVVLVVSVVGVTTAVVSHNHARRIGIKPVSTTKAKSGGSSSIVICDYSMPSCPKLFGSDGSPVASSTATAKPAESNQSADSSVPAKPACWWRVNADSAYDDASSRIINQTETAVKAAQDSYQSGWSTYAQEAKAINETYQNANQSLAQAYKGYIETLQGCPASFSPPFVYQMLPTTNP